MFNYIEQRSVAALSSDFQAISLGQSVFGWPLAIRLSKRGRFRLHPLQSNTNEENRQNF
ncbi:hypothetical protein CEV33_2417 [Brucella grignonensis]|uniref:Uncharacterized protein n=1 Tax=Brucella grignonensis TaxID=94627 RepID=A0A256F953_9HYPH|nr:hypothetical protein CEV33_2417 [Brucella grignonensis]